MNNLLGLSLVSYGFNFDVSVTDLEGEEGINSSAPPVLKEKREGILKRFVRRCTEFVSDIRLKKEGLMNFR